MTLYTFLWCMGIRPSTSDISSLFIYFLLFWLLQLWLTAKVRETLELKKPSTFSLLAFFLFRGMHFSWLVKLLSSWSLYLPHQFVTLRIFFYSPLYTNRTRAKAHNWLFLWEVSEASSFTSPSERGRPPLPHMLILVIAIASFSSLYDSFPLFLTGNARLHSHLDDIPLHLPNPLNVFSWLAERLSAWSLHL